MKFIALNSDELDMNIISEYMESIGHTTVVSDESELLNSICESINNSEYYNAVFICPSTKTDDSFDVIKEIRVLENNIGRHVVVVIFMECEAGIYLLEKFSSPLETFVPKNIVKRKLIEIIESKDNLLW